MKLKLENIEIPSVNHYWKNDYRHGRTYISHQGKEFKEIFRHEAFKVGFKPIDGNVQVNLIWHCTKKGRGDLDNKFKVLFDSLKGLAYHDDKQITKIIAEKRQYSGFSGLEIEIKAI